MSFGFSFGDFVTGISLLKSLIDALDGTFGAKTEYRGLIAELYCLERALVAIKEIEVQENSREYDATQQAVRGCRECIDRFILKIASYQSLTAGKSSIKDHVRKITWAQCRKEDLHKFKEDLSIYVSAINVLLNTLQLSSSKQASLSTIASVDAQTDLLREVENSVRNSDSTHNNTLQRIERLLQDHHAQYPESPSSSFLVRPLRLIDAPVAPNFVPRTQIMLDMEKCLLPLSPDMQKILVLCGPGGIGKSQMVRDYASRHRDDYDSLFWTNGRSEQSLRTSMARIAELIPLPRVLDSNQKVAKNEGDIVKAMHAVDSWLTSAGNSRWLVIIDNVDTQVPEDDDEEISQTGGGYDVARYIPSVAQGTVVITSRLSFLARDLGAQNLPIGEMELEEALQVLQKASGRPYNETGADQLVRKLGAYPLALMQAARYIYENHTTTLTYFERYERDRKLLLEQNLARREYKGGSIDVTLGLSLEALKSRKPEAAAFLMLCGFFDNRDIFWKFVNVAYQFADPYAREEGAVLSYDDPSSIHFHELSPSWLDEIARDEATFDAMVKFLYEFSFVRWNEESDGFSIHSIIHEWIVSQCDSQTRSKLLALAANVVAGNYGAQSDIPSQRIQPHADRCVSLGTPNHVFRTWSFTPLFLLGAFYYDNQELKLAQQLIGCALEKLISVFGDNSEMTALWCMRISPMFIHLQPIETHIQDLLLAKVKLTSASVVPRRVNQNRVDVGNHLCYAYQKQGNFKKAMEVGEGVIESAASVHVDRIYTCCATGLLAESYLVNGRYESAKCYANMAVAQHEQVFGLGLNDGSLSAWRRRNRTIMAIACAFLGEYELAEVILVSVHVEAVRYEGPDADLSVHARHNLDCLRNTKARQEQPSTTHSDGAISLGQDDTDQKVSAKSMLQKLSTDRDIAYLRFDLAMGLFETLGFVDHQIRIRGKIGSSGTSRHSSRENVTPLTAQLAAAACLVQ